jgi:hypothetical protein
MIRRPAGLVDFDLSDAIVAPAVSSSKILLSTEQVANIRARGLAWLAPALPRTAAAELRILQRFLRANVSHRCSIPE